MGETCEVSQSPEQGILPQIVEPLGAIKNAVWLLRTVPYPGQADIDRVSNVIRASVSQIEEALKIAGQQVTGQLVDLQPLYDEERVEA